MLNKVGASVCCVECRGRGRMVRVWPHGEGVVHSIVN